MGFILVDILPLKDGRRYDEATAYFDKAAPIMARHGITRVDAPLQAVKAMRGTQAADMVNLFAADDPQTAMPALAGDPDYQALVPERDALFDLEKSSVILTRRG